jgi:glycosyltransferase involved in cell wall biosynthesis
MGYGGAIVLHLHNDHLGHWTISQLDSLARGLNAVAVCSDYLHRTFAKKSTLLAAKSRVIFNGANLELLYPRYEAREPKTILFVGRLDPEKGVLQLLQAYEKVLEMHPDAKLVIGGSTGYGKHQETIYVQQVQELANRLTQEKSAQIFFTGYLDHEKGLLPWLQRATIFVSPSLVQETFGLVNAEAMACATTVVSSNRGGIPEVVGEAGRLVDPEDVEQLAATISELLSAPSLCRRLGEAGYERCRKMFDWSVIAQDWITLLENVARSSKNS